MKSKAFPYSTLVRPRHVRDVSNVAGQLTCKLGIIVRFTRVRRVDFPAKTV